MKIEKLLKRYRIEHGKDFRLKDYDPADMHGLKSKLKPQAKELLADGVEEMSRLQDIFAAQDRWGLLLIFQALDAGGKDGTPEGRDFDRFCYENTGPGRCRDHLSRGPLVSKNIPKFYRLPAATAACYHQKRYENEKRQECNR
jgi:hypothetical protein